jgi:hypothetical protein
MRDNARPADFPLDAAGASWDQAPRREIADIEQAFKEVKVNKGTPVELRRY